MSAIVDSTYHAAFCRFQRGGTSVHRVSRPAWPGHQWSFYVELDSHRGQDGVTVAVGILERNVYKVGDKVHVTVSGLTGGVPSKRFEPAVGNVPSLDQVESFVRSALAQNAARAVSKPVETSSVKSDPVEEIPAEPERPEPLPEPIAPPLRRRDKSRRRGRAGSVTAPEDSTDVEASQVHIRSEGQS